MTEPGPRCYRPQELEALLLDPGWVDGEEASCLVLELPERVDGSHRDLAERLTRVAIPVVGFGVHHDTPLADAVDVWAGSEQELAALADAIHRQPAAAAVLVQVLRGVGRLPVLDALALESLGYATLQAGREFADWLSSRPRRPAKPAPDGQPVVLTRQADALEIVLNAPHNRNALSVAMRDGLTEAFALVAMAPDIGQVTVRGNGPSFCAGGDLTEFGTVADPALAHAIRMRRMPARYLAPDAHRYHFHVHGACVGAGIELAAFGRRVTATGDAFFQLPEVAMGLIPGAGGCVSIPRRIGRQRAACMALSGRRIDAREALAWGLVDRVEE